MNGPIKIEDHLSWSYTEKVQEICTPFFEKLCLNYADYARYYHDSRVILLYTDKNYVSYFLQDSRYTDRPPSKIIKNGYHLWEEYIDSCFLDIAAKKFNHVHGITIANENDNFVEIINFASDPCNTSILGFYLNQQTTLQHLVDYFRKSVERLVKDLEVHPLILLPNSIQPDLESTAKDFYDLNEILLDISGHTIRINHESIDLSEREAQCLYLLYKGNTSKEIARKLAISPRTIEMYLDKVRFKTNSKNRIDLLSKLNIQNIQSLEVSIKRKSDVKIF